MVIDAFKGYDLKDWRTLIILSFKEVKEEIVKKIGIGNTISIPKEKEGEADTEVILSVRGRNCRIESVSVNEDGDICVTVRDELEDSLETFEIADYETIYWVLCYVIDYFDVV